MISRTMLALALCLGAGPPLSAQQSATVTLNVTDLRSTEGQLVVCLFATRDRFPTCRAGDGVPRHVFPVTARTMRVAVPLPRTGSYAVTVIHDEDTNGRLRQNFIGMPVEGVGVSNNPGGIPRFAGSVVDLRAGASVGVRMRYL
jgi:uncharacterized protein (DUF2141 family)